MRITPITTYVGLGSNVGDVSGNIRRAVLRLGRLPQTQTMRLSSLYLTAPIESIGGDYVNAVVELETFLTAKTLLKALQEIEIEFGRTRPFPNAPRKLDLDILLYGNEIITSEDLTVPHPNLHERAFALVPLIEIAPLAEIPRLGQAKQFLRSVAHQRICQLSS